MNHSTLEGGEIIPRLARVNYETFTGGDWDDLTEGGLEQAQWLQSSAAVLRRFKTIMKEQGIIK